MIDGNTICSNNSKIYEVHLVLFVSCQVENVILFLILYFIYHLPSPLSQLGSPFSTFCCVQLLLFLIYSTFQRSFDFLHSVLQNFMCSICDFCAVKGSLCMVKLTAKLYYLLKKADEITESHYKWYFLPNLTDCHLFIKKKPSSG